MIIKQNIIITHRPFNNKNIGTMNNTIIMPSIFSTSEYDDKLFIMALNCREVTCFPPFYHVISNKNE